MKVFVWKRKDDNKIATVRTMSESDFIILHETKEKVLQLIERKNANEKEPLKVELIEDSMLIEIIEWYVENNRPIVIEGADSLKKRLKDLEDTAENLMDNIFTLRESLFNNDESQLLEK